MNFGSESGGPESGGPLAAVRRLWLALVELLGIFAADLALPSSVALGAFYAVPLLFCFDVAGRREVLWVAFGSTLLCPTGAMFGADGFAGTDMGVLVPATTGVFAIWLTARLVLLRLADEERLFATRELNEIALGSTADGVLVAGDDDRVSWINPAAERMLGWRLAEAVGMSLDELVRREPVEAANGPGAPDSRVTVLLRSGGRLQVEMTEGTIRDLSRRPRGRVLVLRDDSQRAALEHELRELAFRDRLTGLANRALLTERMDLELAHAQRDGTRLAVLFIDLDGFKQINDRFGHHVGDDVLRGVAARMRGSLRAADTVARLAGDEFVVLLPRITDREDVGPIAAKVLESLSEPFVLAGERLEVTPSIGVALLEDDGETAHELLQRADQAMYRAKAAGGARYAFTNSEPTDGRSAEGGPA
ncbi:MAG: GGDEF domain-containing protein [Planctomycetota bacterium]